MPVLRNESSIGPMLMHGHQLVQKMTFVRNIHRTSDTSHKTALRIRKQTTTIAISPLENWRRPYTTYADEYYPVRAEIQLNLSLNKATDRVQNC